MLEQVSIDYINGYLMTNLQKLFRKCEVCTRSVRCMMVTDLLQRRVKRANQKITLFYRKCFNICGTFLSKRDNCIQRNISARLCEIIARETDDVRFPCERHNTKYYLIKRFVHFYIHSWCNNVNHSLKGDHMSWVINLSDQLKADAQARAEKYRTRNKGIAQTKKLKQ